MCTMCHSNGFLKKMASVSGSHTVIMPRPGHAEPESSSAMGCSWLEIIDNLRQETHQFKNSKRKTWTKVEEPGSRNLI